LAEEFTEIFLSFKGERKELIPLLHKVQEKQGYLSEKAIILIAKFLDLSKSEVFGVASFYSLFRFTPLGKHTIKVCLGTACHVLGGVTILETIERELGIHSGETTKDSAFSLETVACFGCCALAPVMLIDNELHGKMTTEKVKKILALYKNR
jgi:NADH-quinone oxidoreductase subunit E